MHLVTKLPCDNFKIIVNMTAVQESFSQLTDVRVDRNRSASFLHGIGWFLMSSCKSLLRSKHPDGGKSNRNVLPSFPFTPILIYIT